MARGKQNQSQQKDGKHRKETKEERKIRIEEQQRAREACEKWIPYAAGVVLFMMIVFGGYVRSVPPKVVPVPAEPLQMTPVDAMPPQDMADSIKQAMDEAPQDIPEADVQETVEL